MQNLSTVSLQAQALAQIYLCSSSAVAAAASAQNAPLGSSHPFFFCSGLRPTLSQLYPNSGHGGSITKLNLSLALRCGYYINIEICLRICKSHVDLWLKPFWLKPLQQHSKGFRSECSEVSFFLGPTKESKPPTPALHQPSWCMIQTQGP